MEYFYTDPLLITETSLVLKGGEFKHLHKVLRKKVGDTVFVVDGKGTVYESVIKMVDGDQAECTIVRSIRSQTEPDVDVTLTVGLLRNPSRFDFLVEKAVELGVRTIVPLRTRYTIPSTGKQERWKQLAISAMKQSGRAVLTSIKPLMTFDEALLQNAELKLIAHEGVDTEHSMPSVLAGRPRVRSVSVLIGPEGGFSAEELKLAAHHQWIPVSLGRRRLRAETAAIVSVALCIFQRGEASV